HPPEGAHGRSWQLLEVEGDYGGDHVAADPGRDRLGAQVAQSACASSHAARMRRVSSPTCPPAIFSFSTPTTGSTPQEEFVRKTSSAFRRSSMLSMRRRRGILACAAHS